MCQRRQKSVMDDAEYGRLKFSGSWKPNIRPSPIAMSEYPEKSKYNCTVYASAPSHALTVVSWLVCKENTLLTTGATLSATMTFFDKPTANRGNPAAKSANRSCDGVSSWSAISWNRTIGPAM